MKMVKVAAVKVPERPRRFFVEKVDRELARRLGAFVPNAKLRDMIATRQTKAEFMIMIPDDDEPPLVWELDKRKM